LLGNAVSSLRRGKNLREGCSIEAASCSRRSGGIRRNAKRPSLDARPAGGEHGPGNMPNTWYARLAIDRLWFDKLQTLVDPDYRGSWRRMQQRARKEGQGYWWGSGESTPERAPDLGTAFGQ
jgi:hypothetical protein